jgi:hypothetical protein
LDRSGDSPFRKLIAPTRLSGTRAARSTQTFGGLVDWPKLRGGHYDLVEYPATEVFEYFAVSARGPRLGEIQKPTSDQRTSWGISAFSCVVF